MGFDSPVHWLIVILIIALLFGGSRVGSLMGELGKGLRAFKQNMAEPNEAAKPAPPVRIAEAVPPVQGGVRAETMVTPRPVPEPAIAEPAMPPDAKRR
jgi:sec-independent protein translocase protein TatA